MFRTLEYSIPVVTRRRRVDGRLPSVRFLASSASSYNNAMSVADILKNATLVSQDGSPVVLEGKRVGLYFSAHVRPLAAQPLVC